MNASPQEDIGLTEVCCRYISPHSFIHPTTGGSRPSKVATMASVRRRRCGVVRADFHYDPVVDVGRQIPSEVVEGPKEARESEGPRNCPVVCPGAGLQGTVHEGTPKKEKAPPQGGAPIGHTSHWAAAAGSFGEVIQRLIGTDRRKGCVCVCVCSMCI